MASSIRTRKLSLWGKKRPVRFKGNCGNYLVLSVALLQIVLGTILQAKLDFDHVHTEGPRGEDGYNNRYVPYYDTIGFESFLLQGSESFGKPSKDWRKKTIFKRRKKSWVRGTREEANSNNNNNNNESSDKNYSSDPRVAIIREAKDVGREYVDLTPEWKKNLSPAERKKVEKKEHIERMKKFKAEQKIIKDLNKKEEAARKERMREVAKNKQLKEEHQKRKLQEERAKKARENWQKALKLRMEQKERKRKEQTEKDLQKIQEKLKKAKEEDKVLENKEKQFKTIIHFDRFGSPERDMAEVELRKIKKKREKLAKDFFKQYEKQESLLESSQRSLEETLDEEGSEVNEMAQRVEQDRKKKYLEKVEKDAKKVKKQMAKVNHFDIDEDMPLREIPLNEEQRKKLEEKQKAKVKSLTAKAFPGNKAEKELLQAKKGLVRKLHIPMTPPSQESIAEQSSSDGDRGTIRNKNVVMSLEASRKYQAVWHEKEREVEQEVIKRVLDGEFTTTAVKEAEKCAAREVKGNVKDKMLITQMQPKVKEHKWYYIEQEPHVYHRCFPSDFIPLYALSEMLRVYKAKMAIVEKEINKQLADEWITSHPESFLNALYSSSGKDSKPLTKQLTEVLTRQPTKPKVPPVDLASSTGKDGTRPGWLDDLGESSEQSEIVLNSTILNSLPQLAQKMWTSEESIREKLMEHLATKISGQSSKSDSPDATKDVSESSADILSSSIESSSSSRVPSVPLTPKDRVKQIWKEKIKKSKEKTKSTEQEETKSQEMEESESEDRPGLIHVKPAPVTYGFPDDPLPVKSLPIETERNLSNDMMSEVNTVKSAPETLAKTTPVADISETTETEERKLAPGVILVKPADITYGIPESDLSESPPKEKNAKKSEEPEPTISSRLKNKKSINESLSDASWRAAYEAALCAEFSMEPKPSKTTKTTTLMGSLDSEASTLSMVDSVEKLQTSSSVEMQKTLPESLKEVRSEKHTGGTKPTDVPNGETKAKEEPTVETKLTEEQTSETKHKEKPTCETKHQEKPTGETKPNEGATIETKLTEEQTSETKHTEKPTCETKPKEATNETKLKEEATIETKLTEEPTIETKHKEVLTSETKPKEEPTRETKPKEEATCETKPKEEPSGETKPKEEPSGETKPKEEPSGETKPKAVLGSETKPKQEPTSENKPSKVPASDTKPRKLSTSATSTKKVHKTEKNASQSSWSKLKQFVKIGSKKTSTISGPTDDTAKDISSSILDDAAQKIQGSKSNTDKSSHTTKVKSDEKLVESDISLDNIQKKTSVKQREILREEASTKKSGKKETKKKSKKEKDTKKSSKSDTTATSEMYGTETEKLRKKNSGWLGNLTVQLMKLKHKLPKKEKDSEKESMIDQKDTKTKKIKKIEKAETNKKKEDEQTESESDSEDEHSRAEFTQLDEEGHSDQTIDDIEKHNTEGQLIEEEKAQSTKNKYMMMDVSSSESDDEEQAVQKENQKTGSRKNSKTRVDGKKISHTVGEFCEVQFSQPQDREDSKMNTIQLKETQSEDDVQENQRKTDPTNTLEVKSARRKRRRKKPKEKKTARNYDSDDKGTASEDQKAQERKNVKEVEGETTTKCERTKYDTITSDSDYGDGQFDMAYKKDKKSCKKESKNQQGHNITQYDEDKVETINVPAIVVSDYEGIETTISVSKTVSRKKIAKEKTTDNVVKEDRLRIEREEFHVSSCDSVDSDIICLKPAPYRSDTKKSTAPKEEIDTSAPENKEGQWQKRRAKKTKEKKSKDTMAKLSLIENESKKYDMEQQNTRRKTEVATKQENAKGAMNDDLNAVTSDLVKQKRRKRKTKTDKGESGTTDIKEAKRSEQKQGTAGKESKLSAEETTQAENACAREKTKPTKEKDNLGMDICKNDENDLVGQKLALNKSNTKGKAAPKEATILSQHPDKGTGRKSKASKNKGKEGVTHEEGLFATESEIQRDAIKSEETETKTDKSAKQENTENIFVKSKAVKAHTEDAIKQKSADTEENDDKKDKKYKTKKQKQQVIASDGTMEPTTCGAKHKKYERITTKYNEDEDLQKLETITDKLDSNKEKVAGAVDADNLDKIEALQKVESGNKKKLRRKDELTEISHEKKHSSKTERPEKEKKVRLGSDVVVFGTITEYRKLKSSAKDLDRRGKVTGEGLRFKPGSEAKRDILDSDDPDAMKIDELYVDEFEDDPLVKSVSINKKENELRYTDPDGVDDPLAKTVKISKMKTRDVITKDENDPLAKTVKPRMTEAETRYTVLTDLDQPDPLTKTMRIEKKKTGGRDERIYDGNDLDDLLAKQKIIKKKQMKTRDAGIEDEIEAKYVILDDVDQHDSLAKTRRIEKEKTDDIDTGIYDKNELDDPLSNQRRRKEKWMKIRNAPFEVDDVETKYVVLDNVYETDPLLKTMKKEKKKTDKIDKRIYDKNDLDDQLPNQRRRKKKQMKTRNAVIEEDNIETEYVVLDDVDETDPLMKTMKIEKKKTDEINKGIYDKNDLDDPLPNQRRRKKKQMKTRNAVIEEDDVETKCVVLDGVDATDPLMKTMRIEKKKTDEINKGIYDKNDLDDPLPNQRRRKKKQMKTRNAVIEEDDVETKCVVLDGVDETDPLMKTMRIEKKARDGRDKGLNGEDIPEDSLKKPIEIKHNRDQRRTAQDVDKDHEKQICSKKDEPRKEKLKRTSKSKKEAKVGKVETTVVEEVLHPKGGEQKVVADKQKKAQNQKDTEKTEKAKKIDLGTKKSNKVERAPEQAKIKETDQIPTKKAEIHRKKADGKAKASCQSATESKKEPTTTRKPGHQIRSDASADPDRPQKLSLIERFKGLFMVGTKTKKRTEGKYLTEPDQVSESKYEDQITTDSESSAESEIQETESLLIQEPVSQETESLVSPKLKADLRKISQKATSKKDFDSRFEVLCLRKRNEELTIQNARLRRFNSALNANNISLEAENTDLKEKMSQLKQEIQHLKTRDTEPLYHGNQAAIYIPPIYQQALVPRIEGHIDTWHMQALVHQLGALQTQIAAQCREMEEQTKITGALQKERVRYEKEKMTMKKQIKKHRKKLIKQAENMGKMKEITTQNKHNTIGWFPANYVSHVHHKTTESRTSADRYTSTSDTEETAAGVTPVTPFTSGEQVVARHTYLGQEEDELTFTKGSLIKVLDRDCSNWWMGELSGVQGVYPADYVSASTTTMSSD